MRSPSLLAAGLVAKVSSVTSAHHPKCRVCSKPERTRPTAKSTSATSGPTWTSEKKGKAPKNYDVSGLRFCGHPNMLRRGRASRVLQSIKECKKMGILLYICIFACIVFRYHNDVFLFDLWDAADVVGKLSQCTTSAEAVACLSEVVVCS